MYNTMNEQVTEDIVDKIRVNVLTKILEKIDSKNLEIEQCGYVVINSVNLNDIEVVICKNESPEPHHHFVLSTKDTKNIYKLLTKHPPPLILIYHTHVNDLDGFSQTDLESSKASKIPYILINLKTGYCDYFNPNIIKQYVGRDWSWSHTHCYSLIQDYYKQEYNINLDSFYLKEDAEWENSYWNGYLENIEKQGFYKAYNPLPIISDIADGDLILMKIGRTYNPNHCAIMYSVEKNEILHHISCKKSVIESFDNSWRKRVNSIWRYKNAI